MIATITSASPSQSVSEMRKVEREWDTALLRNMYIFNFYIQVFGRPTLTITWNQVGVCSAKDILVKDTLVYLFRDRRGIFLQEQETPGK